MGVRDRVSIARHRQPCRRLEDVQVINSTVSRRVYASRPAAGCAAYSFRKERRWPTFIIWRWAGLARDGWIRCPRSRPRPPVQLRPGRPVTPPLTLLQPPRRVAPPPNAARAGKRRPRRRRRRPPNGRLRRLPSERQSARPGGAPESRPSEARRKQQRKGRRREPGGRPSAAPRSRPSGRPGRALVSRDADAS
jgi:hypothetical protein